MLSVYAAPDELRAAVLAMKRADKAIRSDISARMRGAMSPEWKRIVGARAATKLERRLLLPGTRIAAGNPPALVAASGTRRFGNGLTPNRHAPGVEFGAHDGESEVVNRRGTRYERHTMRHLPARRRAGRVVYPAAAELLPRIAAYWTQSIIRAFLDAADGKA